MEHLVPIIPTLLRREVFVIVCGYEILSAPCELKAAEIVSVGQEGEEPVHNDKVAVLERIARLIMELGLLG